MAKNVHRVPKRQWNRWSRAAQKMFNRLFTMMADPTLYKHPQADKPKREHWKTTKWNVAWTAAQLVDGKW